MQNSITIEVQECLAKKLNGRLLTIKLIVEKLKYYKDSEKPRNMNVRVD